MILGHAPISSARRREDRVAGLDLARMNQRLASEAEIAACPHSWPKPSTLLKSL